LPVADIVYLKDAAFIVVKIIIYSNVLGSGRAQTATDCQPTAVFPFILNTFIVMYLFPDPVGRAVHGVGLLPLACWDSGL